MNRYSNLSTPTVITLNDNAGKVLSTLVTNDNLKKTLTQYNVPQKEFFTFQTQDGVTLNGWMMKPTDFSASKSSTHGVSVGKPIWQAVVSSWSV